MKNRKIKIKNLKNKKKVIYSTALKYFGPGFALPKATEKLGNNLVQVLWPEGPQKVVRTHHRLHRLNLHRFLRWNRCWQLRL